MKTENCKSQIEGQPEIPVFTESIGAALTDSARISVMAAMPLLAPPPDFTRIVLPGEEQEPASAHDCLTEAMQWLDAARAMSIQQAAAPPTSLHVVSASPT